MAGDQSSAQKVFGQPDKDSHALKGGRYNGILWLCG